MVKVIRPSRNLTNSDQNAITDVGHAQRIKSSFDACAAHSPETLSALNCYAFEKNHQHFETG